MGSQRGQVLRIFSSNVLSLGGGEQQEGCREDKPGVGRAQRTAAVSAHRPTAAQAEAALGRPKTPEGAAVTYLGTSVMSR